MWLKVEVIQFTKGAAIGKPDIPLKLQAVGHESDNREYLLGASSFVAVEDVHNNQATDLVEAFDLEPLVVGPHFAVDNSKHLNPLRLMVGLYRDVWEGVLNSHYKLTYS